MDLETMAKSEVSRIISQTPHLVPHISTDDREPVWDGYIDVFSNEETHPSQEDCIARIPVVIKTVVEDSFNYKLIYPIIESDLCAFGIEKYLAFFIVCYDRQEQYQGIYCRVFTPSTISRILHQKDKDTFNGLLSHGLIFTHLFNSIEDIDRFFLHQTSKSDNSDNTEPLYEDDEFLPKACEKSRESLLSVLSTIVCVLLSPILSIAYGIYFIISFFFEKAAKLKEKAHRQACYTLSEDTEAISVLIEVNLYTLYSALIYGDATNLQNLLRNYLLTCTSHLDLQQESNYHCYLNGLFSNMNYYDLISNRESGDGRPDIQLIPKREYIGEIPGIIIEVKAPKGKAEPNLESITQQAINQINDKHYDAEMVRNGIHSILKYGIAFHGKNVAVKVERTEYSELDF